MVTVFTANRFVGHIQFRLSADWHSIVSRVPTLYLYAFGALAKLVYLSDIEVY